MGLGVERGALRKRESSDFCHLSHLHVGGVDGLSWCVCGPARARRLRQCLGSDGIGRLGAWTWHFFSDGNSRFIHSTAAPKKIRRHRFCQGFRRWKVKSDIMDDANERTGPRDRKRQSARPTSDQRWSIDSQVPDGNGSGLGWASVSFPDAINPLPHRVLPGASVETAMATRGSEHLRHLQWSRPRRRERGGRAGCRRRQREKEEGPVRSLRVAGGERGERAKGREGEGDAWFQSVRGIGKREGDGRMRGIRVSLIGRDLACWFILSHLIPVVDCVWSVVRPISHQLFRRVVSVPRYLFQSGTFFFVFFFFSVSHTHTPFSSPRAVNRFRFQPQNLCFFIHPSPPLPRK